MIKKRLGIFWLIVVVLVLIVGYGIKLKKQIKYDPVLGINLLLVGENKLAVVVLKNEEEQASFLILPEELAVSVGSDGGRYRVGRLWGLGELEKKVPELILTNVSAELGLKLTGYLKVDDDNIKPEKLLLTMTDISVKTNLSFWDRWRLWLLLRKVVVSGNLIETNLGLDLVEKQVDPDGQVNFWLDRDKFHLWSQREWVNPIILEERASVAVFNNSSFLGRARDMARMLETMGVKIVELKNVDYQSNECHYLVFREGLEKTIRLLERDFGCKEGEFEPVLGSGRVDIEILVGSSG